MPALPEFTQDPIPYPGCCLALSKSLLTYIHSILPTSPSLILSIGSGYGLLEAALLQAPYTLNVVGVEVQPSPNKFLPSLHHRCVPGSRFHEQLAGQASAWLFVYPRRIGLVQEYLALHGKSHSLKMVVWMGPRADWEDYKGCFGDDWNVCIKAADEAGGRAWELIAIAKKSQKAS
ncbi:hypothetical protein BU24DRAFT_392131 [Aaosphaeria arxii CBS 175.79]|uniref:Uncharacterized protein n=1 Tax=Aaosphaeria arxii CBS 175.79 TaxID=1450172 RepID=A0A6A5XU83_9PLEO|nr:uncharacterized protein BU24DRAFT_392131 [Aaosphaeria arxii CBS 175.79]KAF2016762.1 hypothetical protein BU24DRAFT_392131 [Aaosphaeria arxii CBS 175.79]